MCKSSIGKAFDVKTRFLDLGDMKDNQNFIDVTKWLIY